MFMLKKKKSTYLKNALLMVGGVKLYPTPPFVPEGISSSKRDFILLVLFKSISGLLIREIKFLRKLVERTCKVTIADSITLIYVGVKTYFNEFIN